MSLNFPPNPIFPIGIDSDQTLYLVHNSTESVLAADNEPWSDTIDIVPVGENDPELWADNGFGTINGELFYYDAVGRDSNGKVNQLQRVLRNLGGEPTRYNSVVGGNEFCERPGTIVRGFVIAEHHNQLVDAICKIEKFVGINFDPDPATLDFRIRCLQDVPICQDDFSCPVLDLSIDPITADTCQGIQIDYNLDIEGVFNQFRIDFGDGTFTTTDLTGTKTYAPNANIDPVAIASNSRCQVIQTPAIRTSTVEPTAPPDPTTLDIPIVPAAQVPTISIPDIEFVPPDVVVPPILFPCLSLISTEFPGFPGISIGPIFIDIPSLIEFGPVNIPSLIEFGPVSIPELIEFGPVSIPTLILFGTANIPSIIVFGPVEIPSLIEFGPVNIPSLIEFGPANIPSQIEVVGCAIPSQIEIVGCEIPSIIEFGPAPEVSVVWSPAPTISCVVSVDCPSATPIAGWASELDGTDPSVLMTELAEEVGESLNIDLDNIGIPSEIRVVAPKLPEVIQVRDSLPKRIAVDNPNIPKKIEFGELPTPIPQEIKLVSELEIPNSIEIIGTAIPEVIKLDASGIPDFIRLAVPDDFPQKIKLDASDIPGTIQVVGCPETIELKHNLPEEIYLSAPDDLEIPVVWKGAPLDLNVKVDLVNNMKEAIDDEEIQCVAILPCPKK